MVRRAHLLKVLFLLALSSGVASALQLRDDLGHPVSLKAPPRRIVSLAPSVTEVLFAVGAGPQVVGVADFCNRPPEAEERAKVGGFASPDLWRILRLRPDLVLAFGPLQLEAVRALRRKGVAVFWLYPRGLEEVLEAFVRIGRITGHPQEGLWLREAVKKRLEVIRGRLGEVPEGERPKVFRVMGLEPLGTVGGRSFQSSVFRAAGGKNVFEDVPEDFFSVDPAEVLRRDPDVVIACSDGEPSRVLEGVRSGLRGLKAVREGRVLILPCDLICRPGPRVAEAVARIASFLYPEKVFVPERVVSLVPSLTEEVYLLGAEDRLVGVTTYCRRPPEAQRKPKVGTVVEFSVERVLALRPQLVLASPLASRKGLRRLRGLGFWVEVFSSPRSFQELGEEFLRLAALLGREERAVAVLREACRRLAALKERVPPNGPRVFVQIGANPLFAAGDDSIVSEAVRMAGGENVVHGPSAPYSREVVLKADPDVILIVTMGVVGERERRVWEGFEGLKAAREGRIYTVDSELFCSPTPLSFVEAVGRLVDLFYPSGAHGEQ